MYRLFPSLLCTSTIAISALVIAGCGGSPSTTNKGSGTSPTSGGGTTGNSVTVCGGPGSGYNNQNGSITGVWLQTPNPGPNPSHVDVNAVAYGPSTPAKWAVCLDDQPAYQTSTPTTSVAQGIDMTPGQHLLYARAWDAQGNSNRSEVKLIQVGPPPPSDTVLPTPPANAQVLSEIQNNTADWTICSLCAAGTNTTGNYSMKFDQAQPSMSGSSLEMYADGASWTNVLFMDTKLATTSNNSHFLWDFWVYHDPAVEAHFWSSEFDFWQVLGGKEFMIGSQCDFGDGYWSTWDSAGGRWVLNGIPCPHWSAGWHHVQWYLERISPTQYRYDTLVFDGTAYGLNQTWTYNATPWLDMIGVQYQLDQDPSGTPLHEWVDKVTLTMW